MAGRPKYLMSCELELLSGRVDPRMPGRGGSAVDFVSGAGVFEGMSPQEFAVGDCLPGLRHGRPASARRRELGIVVGENAVDLSANFCAPFAVECSAA